MSTAPLLNTWLTRNAPQTRASSAAACGKSAAPAPITAALIAPAEVPQRIENGSGSPGRHQPAIAFSTPT